MTTKALSPSEVLKDFDVDSCLTTINSILRSTHWYKSGFLYGTILVDMVLRKNEADAIIKAYEDNGWLKVTIDELRINNICSQVEITFTHLPQSES